MSVDAFFAKVPFRAKLLGWGILLGPLLVLVLLARVFLRPEPMPSELVYGCYIADNAPWLEVEPGRIRVGDAERHAFAYVLEPAKEGYRLSVSPAMALNPQPNGRYEFRNERGIGYFWPLLPKSSDLPRDLRSPKDFGGRFSITARDSRDVLYVRSSRAEACE
ncbi:hypothetical protein [Novosphingobium sp.]|jgi:hypothetical protein|uniref:hypothetical protein n=1 Tax=Novosphingobium sp. TaxID=1874826 RepID=UPI00352B2458